MDIQKALLQLGYVVERTHRRHITQGFGMMQVYEEKAAEATDFAAGGFKRPSNYPLIYAEAKARKITSKKVAEDILEKRGEYIAICAEIERIRFTAKEKFKNAKTRKSIRQAFKEAVTALDKL